ncbi:MAG: glycosyltransferase [Candidatus Glassbacteria bacterium]|nr:glycosyltransferase [Candidatus Glassbacteria bacterium]
MGLRISINSRRIEGPYGGINQFTVNLENYLRSRDHEVFRELVPGLDLILIVSSKTNVLTTSFTPDEAADYLALHPNTVTVQRVNTCNESRAADLGINQAVLAVNRLVDYTVFVSRFIKEFYSGQGLDPAKPQGVILTGVNEAEFEPSGAAEWTPGAKMKIATHHWSGNYMKGFDTYERLDLLLEKKPFKDFFEFTYIGNIPPGFNFRNTEVAPPLQGQKLVACLKESHLYLTGARHEAGGNHYIEAMRCGLPVVYLDSGSSAEYCSPYGGVGFTPVDFEERLLEARSRYAELRNQVMGCPYTAAWMGTQYEELFEKLVARRRAEPAAGPGAARIFCCRARSLGRKLNALRRALFRRLGA